MCLRAVQIILMNKMLEKIIIFKIKESLYNIHITIIFIT